MTIYELRELFIDDDQDCYIYNLDTQEEVYKGSMRDIPEELEDREISSLDNVYADNNGVIGINIAEEE